MKLEANFLKVSPAYLTATSGLGINGSYGAPPEIAVTPLIGNGTKTNFYVVRQADFTSTMNTYYKLNVSTSFGEIAIPQLGGTLALNGRDSKIHVTDYDVGGIDLVYSSAEIFTWAKTASGRILVLYGGVGETHEAAFSSSLGTPKVTEGSGVVIRSAGSTWVLHWQVTPARRVVKIGDLEIHFLWRNEAYNYWVVDIEAPAPVGNFTSASKSTVIINGGYLIRSASISGNELRLIGDVNATTDFEVVSTPTNKVTTLSFNGATLKTRKTREGRLTATLNFKAPSLELPAFSGPKWKYIDSLPEIQSAYDDSLWTSLDHLTTNNPRNLTTPTSTYASDYGYHTGSLIYRGHFTSNANESTFFVNITGGAGFGHSIWLNDTFLTSWVGSGSNQTYWQTPTLPSLQKGSKYVLTVLIDHTGQDEEAPGTDAIKFPRGILDYSLAGHPQSDVKWKMTGNLGGEQYHDLARGPRNEGAMFAERQGYHLPKPPSSKWKTSSPIENGISKAGIGFYSTSFDLNVPAGYDVPMSFVLNQTTSAIGTSGTAGNYRCQLFVNGYQFGKYGMCLYLGGRWLLTLRCKQPIISVHKLPFQCQKVFSTIMEKTMLDSHCGHWMRKEQKLVVLS
jgi:beta-galactosidase